MCFDQFAGKYFLSNFVPQSCPDCQEEGSALTLCPLSGSVIVVTQKGILSKLIHNVTHSQIKPRYRIFLFRTVNPWVQKREMELVMQGEEEKKLHWVYAIIF